MQDITLNAPKLFDLTGNVALVTGAGSGIGQRIAMGLAQCGADVALLDRRSDDGLTRTADFIAAAGRRSITVAADVTSTEAVGDAVTRTEAELGALTPGSQCSWHRQCQSGRRDGGKPVPDADGHQPEGRLPVLLRPRRGRC